MQRYVHNTFSESCTATIGVDFGLKTIEIDDTAQVRLQLWDTAGQEKYTSLVTNYLRTCFLFFIVFDITQWDSFLRAALWLSRLQLYSADNVDIVLVGNMADRSYEREVPIDTAQAWATENGLSAYYEVSAKTGAGVHDAFEHTIHRIYENLEAVAMQDTGGVILSRIGHARTNPRRRNLELWKPKGSHYHCC